jgi:hypothetical protein
MKVSKKDIKEWENVPVLYLSFIDNGRWQVIFREMPLCAETDKDTAVNLYYKVRNGRKYFDPKTDSFKLIDGMRPMVFSNGQFEPLSQI